MSNPKAIHDRELQQWVIRVLAHQTKTDIRMDTTPGHGSSGLGPYSLYWNFFGDNFQNHCEGVTAGPCQTPDYTQPIPAGDNYHGFSQSAVSTIRSAGAESDFPAADGGPLAMGWPSP